MSRRHDGLCTLRNGRVSERRELSLSCGVHLLIGFSEFAKARG